MPDADATPAADGGATPPAPTDTPPATGDDRQLANAREALTRVAKERDDAREALKKYEDKDKSDLQLATERVTAAEQRVATLEAEVRASRFERAALAAAQKQGFWDPEVGASLVNPSEVQYDDAGNPKNLDALLTAIAKAKPRLVNGNAGQPDFGGGSRGGSASGADMNALIRAAAGRT